MLKATQTDVASTEYHRKGAHSDHAPPPLQPELQRGWCNGRRKKMTTNVTTRVTTLCLRETLLTNEPKFCSRKSKGVSAAPTTLTTAGTYKNACQQQQEHKSDLVGRNLEERFLDQLATGGNSARRTDHILRERGAESEEGEVRNKGRTQGARGTVSTCAQTSHRKTAPSTEGGNDGDYTPGKFNPSSPDGSLWVSYVVANDAAAMVDTVGFDSLNG